MSKGYSSIMKINDYQVWVHLGCSAEEQAVVQPVLFSLEIVFNQKIQAEVSDRLADSIDYVSLIEIIKTAAQQKNYSMIEHLCFSVSEALRANLSGRYAGSLITKIKKIRAPIKNLHHGVEWVCKTDL